MKLFSFFSGIGILDLGFENAGCVVDFVNEISKSFLAAYKYSRINFNIPSPKYGYHQISIEEFLKPKTESVLNSAIIDASKTDLIGFIGGPPCPDFSIGGKNRGHKGDHGKLSLTYIKVIEKYKPDFFLFENVKGLWRTSKHRIFYESLKKRLIRSNYVLAERLINSIEFSVPQDRQRIILIGFRKDLLKKKGLKYNVQTSLLTENDFNWNIYKEYPNASAFNYNWPSTNNFSVDSSLSFNSSVPKELTVQYWFDKNDVKNHPNSIHCFTPRAGLSRFLTVKEGDDSKKSYKRLHRWRYSPTAAYGNNEVHLHPFKARRITVAEALAIQSVPKEYCLPENMSLTDMYKSIGNGVPYLAALKIAKTIKKYLKE